MADLTLFIDFLPILCHAAGMLRTVAVIALPRVAPFELGVLCEVFGIDRSDVGVPRTDFTVVTAEPGRVPTSIGFDLVVEHGLDVADRADLVAVPAYPFGEPVDPRVLDVIRRAVDRGAWVLSVCSGAFALGEAGVLDGRACTIHWMHSAQLAAAHPLARIDADVLYVQDGTVVTSAGTAAGIDASLHIVRSEHGAAVASVIARRMVVPPHRDGGQAQYIDTPVPECADEGFAPLVTWALEHLDSELTVDQMARRAQMSTRTFARRFRAATGVSPASWVSGQRLDRARELLERTGLGVEEVARRAGFGSAAVLRAHFGRLGTTPLAYRRTFAGSSSRREEQPTG